MLTTGYDLYLIQTLAAIFNFTYDVVNGNLTWGSYVNGSWNGIVGLVNRSEADIAIGSLSITSDRFDGIDFSIAYFYDPLTYMLSSDFSNDVREYSLKDSDLIAFGLILFVWFLLSALVAQSIVSISIVSNVRFNSSWNLFKNFLQRGVDLTEEPTELSLRSLTITWLIAGIVSNAAASGALVAILSPSPSKPIDSFEQLSSSSIRPTIPRKSVYTTMLRSSKNMDIQRMTRHLLLTDVKTTSAAIEALVGQPQALIQSSTALRCGRKKLNEHLFYLPPSSAENTFLLDFYGLGLRRNSIGLKSTIDDAIYRLVEGHIVKSWQIKSEDNLRKPMEIVESNLDIDVKPISLMEIDLLIYGLICGLILTTLCLIFEIVKSRKVVRL